MTLDLQFTQNAADWLHAFLQVTACLVALSVGGTLVYVYFGIMRELVRGDSEDKPKRKHEDVSLGDDGELIPLDDEDDGLTLDDLLNDPSSK